MSYRAVSNPPGTSARATRIELFSLRTQPMRVFHMTWLAFFLSFFAWFGLAPLMPVIRDDLGLTQSQVGTTIVASVAATIAMRILIGWLCDRLGPRRTYAWLLMLGAIPVASVGLADSFESFLAFRLIIGCLGASFVITQYHTSVMFAPNVVGMANATTAGWGNLGGGVTQIVMPLVLAAFVSLGVSEAWGWRLAMVIPGLLLFVTGVAYLLVTRDLPAGDMRQLQGTHAHRACANRGVFLEAVRDYRVWALAGLYAACFGIELTINNVAALYYTDRFELGLATAGLLAGLFGLMNLFARTLGGAAGDAAGKRFGLRGRVVLLGCLVLLEGLALILFSRMGQIAAAVGTMILFSTLVQMAEGATFSVVPFVNARALGPVAGIVGAGGNVGAVAAGLMFRIGSLSMADAFLALGVMVAAASSLAFCIRFSPEHEACVAEPSVALPEAAA